MALNVVSSVLGTVANRLDATASAAVPQQTGTADKQTSGFVASTGVGAGSSNVASSIDRIVGAHLGAVGAHMATAEKQVYDPTERRNCVRKGLLFHLFVVVALLALLWCGYVALKILSDDDCDTYYNGAYYSDECGNYPWSLSLQLILSVALLQSLVSHYVSVLPCQRQVHWSVIVVGNVVNGLVFLWLMWLILAVTTPHSGSAAWLLIVTVLVGVAGCIAAAGIWMFCPHSHRSDFKSAEPCPEPVQTA